MFFTDAHGNAGIANATDINKNALATTGRHHSASDRPFSPVGRNTTSGKQSQRDNSDFGGT